ncbi:MAG: sigma-54-dependent Fis family transcriptional regulator [Bacteroidetes bacterium]|nr:MAG: sigma-54-dependent Fis family transcriptional regulator [Bacteroidota bacterium]
MKHSSILVVDDNKSLLSAVELLLSNRCKRLKTLTSPNLLLNELAGQNYDVLLLDMNFSSGINTGNEGIYWLQRVLEKHPAISVVMITAYGHIELAVKAVRLGAVDFITKPWDNQKLLTVVESACRLSDTRKKANNHEHPKQKTTGALCDEKQTFAGESPAWKKVINVVHKVADTDANVLITGENGTGKEIIACMLHRLSSRYKSPMITVDMGAIVESLFESELFGYKKGAFTDAKTDKKGKIEEAQLGTLFLDEIGNLPLAMQTKLLSVLQSRKLTPLGENVSVPIDIRLICATNSNLRERVENGTFREDLLYRINTIHIELPPLRERKEDIPGFAEFFMETYTRKYNKPGMQLSEKAIALLCEYNWPGNIRELQHAIEKAVILSDKDLVKPSDFMFRQYDMPDSNAVMGGTLEEMEEKLIADAILRHQGNMSAVASRLGITRQTLYNKVKKYGL